MKAHVMKLENNCVIVDYEEALEAGIIKALKLI